MKPHTIIKILISAIALAVLGLRIAKPDLNVDTIVFALLVVAFIPWLSGVFKSVEVPGLGKVEYRDLEKAENKIDLPPKDTNDNSLPELGLPSYMRIKDQDPNLALAGLRIELEKRLQALSIKAGLGQIQPAKKLINILRERLILNDSTSVGITEIMEVGNRAVHGASVDKKVSDWVFSNGPKLIAALEYKLRKDDVKEPEEKLQRALIFIDVAQQMEGYDSLTKADFREHCISWLDLAKREGSVRLCEGFGTRKERAGKALIKLGSLEPIGGGSDNKYQISGFGELLLSQLLVE